MVAEASIVIPASAFFPIFVNLRNKKCVVAGAGKIAAGKIDGLLAAGAEVLVVSPRAIEAVARRAQAGDLTWLKRRFRAEDVAGASLVVAATNSESINEAVFRACRASGVLCNAVDDPARCDFIYPAVVRRGNLQIAVSTGGRSPALAARLRRDLERQFGPEWGERLERLGEERKAILRGEIPAKKRKQLLVKQASAAAMQKALRKPKSEV